MKGRLLGLLFFLLFAGGIAFNWNLLINHGYYYWKLSGVAPFGALAGLVLMVFPSMAGRPDPANTKFKIMVWMMVAVGLVLGFINWYLMDHYQP